MYMKTNGKLHNVVSIAKNGGKINQVYFVPLREHDTLSRCSDNLFKGDNFCDFLFAFLHIKSNSEKRTAAKKTDIVIL